LSDARALRATAIFATHEYGCSPAAYPEIQQAGKELCYFASKNPDAVETKRLHLFPLNARQLELYIQADNKLEQALCLANTGRTIAPQVQETVTKFTLANMRKVSGSNYLFYTFWLVVDKQSRTIVAELGFKGPPDEAGTVEIGYGTMPAMQGRGYMTEAVKDILQWASTRPDINTVLAEIRSSNTPSIRVVQKNGFDHFDKKGEMLWWKADVQASQIST